MPKQFVKLLLVLALCASLLLGLNDSIKAQNLSSLTTTTSDRKVVRLQADPNIVSWEMLGLQEANLIGPYGSYNFSFNLPADWKLSEGATLNLSLGVSVSTGIEVQPDSTATDLAQPNLNGAIGAGTLTITVNNTTLLTLPLDQVGEIVRTIPIPAAAFTSANTAGTVDVGIALNSGTSCYNFDEMNVVVRTSSFFTLPHEFSQPTTDLVNFPRPIIQYSFIPDSVLLIIPDQPSAAELQAALTVASGLGKLSNGSLVSNIVALSKLTTEQENASNLIFIGKPASLPLLGQLQIPLAVDNGQFQVLDGDANDGFVEMVNSPWNTTKVLLVVSGNTDEGVVKAAQAVSSGVFQPNKFPNLAVVEEVQTTPVLAPQPTDQTLESLGYKGRLFEKRGVNSASFSFNIPPGWIIGSDSSFELVFGHSALLDYAGSGIVVLLNSKPIGSVRMDAASASVSTNKVLMNIPASAIVPGKNRLDVRATLFPQDVCAPPDNRGLWVNIWPESTLHLPLDLAVIDPVSSLSLASYPAPFIYYPLLDNTAFVLMHNNLESWQAAGTIASFLGSIANGPVTALNVYYDDNLPDEAKSKYNLVVIGRPSQMPVMGEINKSLPIPFLDGSDVLTEGNFQVTYRISPDSSLGYMQFLPSPWNSDNVVLAVLGNTAEGLGWATSSLIDSDLRSQLAGNFALINDKQIITTDTRLTPTIRSEPTPIAEVVVLPPSVDTNSPSSAVGQSTWVFPMFVASIVLIIIISAFVTVGSWLRYRTRGNAQRGDRQPNGRGYFGLIKNWFASFFGRNKRPPKD